MMRSTWILLVLIAAVALPGSGAAKGGEAGVRFCGSDGCRTTFDLDLLTQILPALAGEDRSPVVPAQAERVYRVSFADLQGRPLGGWPGGYYVAAARVVRVERTELVEWLPVTTAAHAFDRASRGISPFPAPRLVRVEVGSRLAQRPQSYLRLYDLIARGERAADPLGPRPQLEWRNYKALVRYYRRDRSLWIPLRLHSTTASPWSDEDTQLSIGRRGDLLRGDGVVVRVPHAIATRVRHGLPLGN